MTKCIRIPTQLAGLRIKTANSLHKEGINMFKKYKVPSDPEHPEGSQLEFFVYSRKTPSGFMHEAAMFMFPKHRLGVKYPSADDDRLFKLRYNSVKYVNRTYEQWGGKTVLQGLWEQLSKMKEEFPIFASPCPFDGDEPNHEDIPEPDDLFGLFRMRG